MIWRSGVSGAAKKLCLVLVVILLLCCGCSARKYADMPDIVFVCCRYYEYAADENDRRSVTFLDKNGNYYSVDDSGICALPFDELTEKFASDDEGFTLIGQKCGADEIEENYRKICDMAGISKYELKYPDALPTVQADSAGWYGLYYDGSVKLCALPVHRQERMTDIYANDDRANEVYEWYTNSIKTG